VVAHFLQRGRTGVLSSLVRPVIRVPGTMPADRLLGFLRERRSHQALVTNDANEVEGMITLEDVIGELLGAVPDEFKAPRLLPLRLTNGRVRLPGDLPLDQARVWVEGAWPADGGTVADLIAGEAGRLPEPGDEMDVAGLRVEIESVENGRVASAIVVPPYLEEETDEDGKADDSDELRQDGGGE
jgi:CBS domain containing-hemolysin-like protein